MFGLYNLNTLFGDSPGIMVIVVKNAHGDASSSPRQGSISQAPMFSRRLWIKLIFFLLYVNSRTNWTLTLVWQPVKEKENFEFKLLNSA